MTTVRVQCRFQGDTGIPEDVFINTWHVATGEASLDETMATDLSAAFSEFYLTGIPALSLAVKAFLSPAIASAEWRFYDLADPEPRVPISRTPLYGTPSTNVPMINEAAVCLSMHGDAPVTPRKRGRVYIGPLNTNALASGQTSDARVDGGFRDVLCAAASRLVESLLPLTLIVWSPTSGLQIPVVGGWVDDAFDIQRRRGMDATTRTTWSA